MINYLKFTFYQKNAYFLIELEATKKWIFTRLHLYGVPCWSSWSKRLTSLLRATSRGVWFRLFCDWMSAPLPTNSRVTSGDLNSVARYSEVLPLYFLPFASASACSRRLATKIWFHNATVCKAVHRNHYSHPPASYLATINQPFQYCDPTLPQGNCQRVSNQFLSMEKRYSFPSFILFCSTQICNPCPELKSVFHRFVVSAPICNHFTQIKNT